ncbi:MAG: DNA primase [Puniceicoccales bacterium]|jgi:DNA primase|nr:DNA primase [Puniceicoccales bacterium]
MPIISRESIENIREKVDVLDLVSRYVNLKRSGSSWKGLSPFSDERTPSFYVLPDKKFFKCFSTGLAGDVFRFLQLKENFSFHESVEWLAKKYSITLEYETTCDPSINSIRNELLEIHKIAAEYYNNVFFSTTKDAQAVRKYWTDIRKFSLDVAKKYTIGFSPNADNSLINLLIKKKFSPEALKQSGLFVLNDQDNIDQKKLKLRFNGRLMIPIPNVQGDVVAFSARKIDGITANLSDSKYINSPETPIFHKGSLLFGLDRARKYIQPIGSFYIVEGQLDVIRCTEAGLTTAVTPQGTGITETQLNTLRRYSVKVHCLTDGDEAGLKCAKRIAELSFKTNIDAVILKLPNGYDPDSFILERGSDGIETLLTEGISSIKFIIDTLLPRANQSTPMEKEQALKKIYEILAHCTSIVATEGYLREIASYIGINYLSVQSDFLSFTGKARFSDCIGKKPNRVPTTTKISSVESDILSIVIHHSAIGARLAQLVDDSMIDASGLHGQILIKILSRLKKGLWTGVSSLEDGFWTEAEINEIFSIATDDDGIDDPEDAANICLAKLHKDYIKKRLDFIQKKEKTSMFFTKNKENLDNRVAIESLQEEKSRLRGLLGVPPRL